VTYPTGGAPALPAIQPVIRPLSHSSVVTVSLLLTILAGVSWTVATVTGSKAANERLEAVSKAANEKMEALLQAHEKRIDRLEDRVFTYEAWPAVNK